MPQSGDLIVRRRAQRPLVFAISRHQESDQLTCRTFEHAVDLAATIARVEMVDAWYTEDDATFQPIARYR